jgi:hypothetical protein
MPRKRLAVAAAGVLVLLGWWLLRDHPAAEREEPFQISLRSARGWVLPLGRIELQAVVTPADRQQELHYEWTSEQGVVFGGAPGQATWVAPPDLGPRTVRVTARDRRGRTRSAELPLEVRGLELATEERTAGRSPAGRPPATRWMSRSRPARCAATRTSPSASMPPTPPGTAPGCRRTSCSATSA